MSPLLHALEQNYFVTLHDSIFWNAGVSDDSSSILFISVLPLNSVAAYVILSVCSLSFFSPQSGCLLNAGSSINFMFLPPSDFSLEK